MGQFEFVCQPILLFGVVNILGETGAQEHSFHSFLQRNRGILSRLLWLIIHLRLGEELINLLAVYQALTVSFIFTNSEKFSHGWIALSQEPSPASAVAYFPVLINNCHTAADINRHKAHFDCGLVVDAASYS